MTGPASRMTPSDQIDAALWLERYGAALRQYFRRRVHQADVDDLVQEVLLKLQNTATTAQVDSVERYIFTVARNVLVDRRRVEQAHNPTAYETYARIDGMHDRLSPERILIARDEYARVCRAIVNLPPRPRKAFELHRFGNMTYTEIAAAMQISRETVKDLIKRALTRIALETMQAEPRDD